MEHGTPEQIQSMRDEDGNSKKPGVRTMYEQVQNERIKKELTDSTNVTTPQLKKDNLRLINKDFRIATKEEIPNDSVDLVLVLDFPEPRMREDEQVRYTPSSCRQAQSGFGKDFSNACGAALFYDEPYSKGHVCLHHLSVHLPSSLDRFGEQKVQLNKKELRCEKTYQLGSDTATSGIVSISQINAVGSGCSNSAI